jgi:hypothetical protein
MDILISRYLIALNITIFHLMIHYRLVMMIVNEEIKMKLIRILQIAIILLLSINNIPFTFGNGGDCYLLPEELLNVAREKGFDQINDFYKDRPGMLNPPYAYGYLPGLKENSAVFWCEKKEKKKIKSLSIAMI